MKKQIIGSLFVSVAVIVLAGCAKSPGDVYVSQQTKLAKQGVRWAEFHLWDAYAHGTNGVQSNPVKADQWLDAFVKGVYLVRFESAGNFHPRNASEYLQDIIKHTPQVHSDNDRIGIAGFFRTTKQGDTLVASFLSDEPDKLQSYIEQNPDLKFISSEAVTPQSFVEYEQSVDAAEPVVGIGIALGIRNQKVVIMRVLPNTPASKAGLSVGLVVHKIDGATTEGKSVEDCAGMIRGSVGSAVTLELIDTATSHTNTVEIMRAEIKQ